MRIEPLPAAADSKALSRESKILALGGDNSCQGNSDIQRSRPQAAAGPCPKYSEASPKRANRPQKRKRRPQAAARGHAPSDSDAAPRAAPAGPCLRAKAREPPVGSAASYPPEGFPLSTFGDGGLNCRVRDGTGCAPSSMAADPTGGSGRHPGGQHSAQDRCRLTDRPDSMKLGSRRARPISTARLSTSPCLQLRPIQLLV